MHVKFPKSIRRRNINILNQKAVLSAIRGESKKTMKTIKDLFEYAFHVWYLNIPHAPIVYITDIDKVGADMAYLASQMILEGNF